MPGETVFDPFAGLGTVPYCAVKLGRKGRGHELNPRYHGDAAGYCRAAEREASVPTLFDLDAGAVE
jgi:DNA modification methylase